MLRLQAETEALLVLLSPFANTCAIEEVARVKLNPRLCRVDIHYATAGFFVDGCRKREFVTLLIEDPVVIVSQPELQLLIRVVDPCTDRSWSSEIHRSPLHIPQFARRDERRIDWRKLVGVDREIVG